MNIVEIHDIYQEQCELVYFSCILKLFQINRQNAIKLDNYKQSLVTMVT